MSSRWADTEEDAVENARRKAAKEEKKRLKAEKQRKAEEEKCAAEAAAAKTNGHGNDGERPSKRRRLSQESATAPAQPETERELLRFHAPTWQPCRSVERFDKLNAIEEGSYGYVSRAKEQATGEIVALKKLKLDPVRDGGFPVTALREIQCLHAAKHRHIVNLREVVTGERETRGDVYLVMDFLEHDLKTLQEEMQEPFMPSEVKTLLLQLGSAVEFLHDHWILHRDLKTSNILMNNRGEIKLADFGMARFVGDPAPPNLTQLVVTLWYRSPELLLGATTYGAAVDMWSIGCIFGELLTRNPLLQGKTEVDQLSKIFELCGVPNDETWPGFKRLPNARSLRLPSSRAAQGSIIRSRFSNLTNAGVKLLDSLLSLDPLSRPTAKEMLEHAYFREDPRPKPTAMFPTFPSKAGQEGRRRHASPHAPVRGAAPGLQGEVDFSSIFKGREEEEKGECPRWRKDYSNMMSILNLPPAVRSQIWSRCIKSGIYTSPLGPQRLVSGSLPLRSSSLDPSSRGYATVHISENDKVFQRLPEKGAGEDVLQWNEIMDAARKALDQHSQATVAEKYAVLADLQRRVKTKPSNPTAKRNFIRSFLQAKAAQDPASAIRQMLRERTPLKCEAEPQVCEAEPQVCEAEPQVCEAEPQVQAGSQPLGDSGPSEDRTWLEAPKAKATQDFVAAIDTNPGLSIAELLEEAGSDESEVIDALSVKHHLPLPAMEYRALGYPKSLTKDDCNRITGIQPRQGLYKLCSDAGVRIDHSCDYSSPASGTRYQCCCSLKLQIGDGHLSAIAAGPSKSEAEGAAWLGILSKCHVSGVLQRLSSLRTGATAELQATKSEGKKAQTPKLEVTTPEVQDYRLLDSIKEKEQYANITSRLFQASSISTEINNRCQALNLPHETQINISSEGTVFTCTLNLQIPGIANESSTGRGSSKQTAKKDAWVAMLVKLDVGGAISELFSTSATKRKHADLENEPKHDTPEPLPADEDIELVDVQEDLIKQEKNGKIEVFNYAAKFGLVPEFDLRLLKRRMRGQAARSNAKPVVQVSIKLPEQNIEVSTHGGTTVQAEVAALLAFKRAAEELHARQVEVESCRNFHALSTKTAQIFVEYYRKRKGRTFLEFENEETGYGGETGTMSQLTLDGVPVGRRVAMQTKKAAEEVAYLTAAIELAHRDPDILANFATDLKHGNLARSLGTHAAVRATIKSDALDIMRQTLVEARQAGLPDVRESLTAIETLVGKPRERSRPRTPKALASEQLLQRLKQFEDDPGTAKLRETRASLPMSQYSSKVLDLVSDHVYSIVVGATGSGKTTQVPQIILDDAIRQGNGGSCDIICTQPRRLAASSVAQQVALERGEQLQQSVGYQVRGDSKLPQLGGSITYCTTGLLLERLKWNADDVMDNTSHVVIDEVHERDISIDFLLIVLKKAIRVRQAAGQKVPKVVLMSATMDTKLFSAYFSSQVDGMLAPCPHLNVPGRTFPIKEKYLGDVLGELLTAHSQEFWRLATFDKDATTGYLESEGAFERARFGLEGTSTPSAIDWKKPQVINQEEAKSQAVRKEEGLVPVALLVATIAHICRTTSNGAILAFLPGLQEITATEELLMQAPVFGVNFADADAFQIHLLHSTVPVEKQRQIFEPSPSGCRKIILSTNIAETSVTVPDVQHVVDLGKLRENRYDHVQRITSLQTVWASKSNARQRAGRAGRVSSGNYYALYSLERRKAMSASGLPELLRADLQETCLSIKAQGFQESVSSFLAAAIEPPPSTAVEAAVNNLKAIEALTPDERLTALGAVLAKLPVHPALGKMVLLGIIFRCLDPMIIISSMGTERSLFVSPVGERAQAKLAREDLNVANSDHIALLRGFQEVRDCLNHHGQSAAFSRAQARYLHFGAFRAIHRTAKQIEQNLIDAGLLEVSYDMNKESRGFGGIALNWNSGNIDLVKCLLMAGVYPNIGVRGAHVKGPLHRTASKDKVLLHPSSVNATHGKPSAPIEDQVYAFTTLARNVSGKSVFMRDTSLVSPLAVLLFGGRLEARKHFQELMMDDWLPFKTWGNSAYVLRLILEFRKAKDRMLNGAFRSLSEPTGKGLADDPIREIFAKGLVTLLDANGPQSERENWLGYHTAAAFGGLSLDGGSVAHQDWAFMCGYSGFEMHGDGQMARNAATTQLLH
ncbi:hypothetical protein AC579_9323 [Pseudocercospora musae]|uniref:RNA helicase n=1 Tax=Pseudocercospora musae TaxID=113226 RepID=A0A139I5F0_9PEZI|nr:hypothetical protein AC579_9323 [Pseudocercospora musae]